MPSFMCHVVVGGTSSLERRVDVDVSGSYIDVRGVRHRRMVNLTSTFEREVDVCARSNFVTNGFPYARRRERLGTRLRFSSLSNFRGQSEIGCLPTLVRVYCKGPGPG